MTAITTTVGGTGGGCVTFIKAGDADSIADLKLEVHGATLVVCLGHWECSRIAGEAAARSLGAAAHHDEPFNVDTVANVERMGQPAGRVTFTATATVGGAMMRLDDGDGGHGEIELGREGLSELALAMAAAAGEM